MKEIKLFVFLLGKYKSLGLKENEKTIQGKQKKLE